MMIYLAIVMVAAVGVLTGYATSHAIRQEYLLVLRWREHGLWLFERGEDGRFQRIPLGALPAALVRYAWIRYQQRPRAAGMTPGTPTPETV
jgi:hypothetical protein